MGNDFTEFYFVRHGESMANINNRLHGWGNAPLTENGRAQAQCAAKALADVRFDIAYSSFLDRTITPAYNSDRKTICVNGVRVTLTAVTIMRFTGLAVRQNPFG